MYSVVSLWSVLIVALSYRHVWYDVTGVLHCRVWFVVKTKEKCHGGADPVQQAVLNSRVLIEYRALWCLRKTQSSRESGSLLILWVSYEVNDSDFALITWSHWWCLRALGSVIIRFGVRSLHCFSSYIRHSCCGHLLCWQRCLLGCKIMSLTLSLETPTYICCKALIPRQSVSRNEGQL